MAVDRASDNPFPSVLFEEHVDPSNPAAGFKRLFVDTDHILKTIDSSGTVVQLGQGMTDPMTTRGDIIYRNSSNATARLARGSATQVLTSDGTDIAWATPSSGFSDPMTTRGDIIVRNAANATARLAVGSSGKVLSSDGTDVSWQTPTGGGSVLLEQHTASSSATLDYTTSITSTYDEYLIELVSLVPATNNVDLYLRFSTDGGSTYDTSNLYSATIWAYTSSSSAASGAAYGSPTSQIPMRSNAEISNTSTGGISGQLRLFSPLSTALYKWVSGQCVFFSGSSTVLGVQTNGVYKSTTAVNAFRFLFSSGNIASGTIRVYGIAK